MPAALDWTGEQLLAEHGEPRGRARNRDSAAARAARPELLARRLLRRFHGGAQAALIGIPLGSEERLHQFGDRHLTRTAALDGGFYRYDKHHLVPFGEFVRRCFRWFTRMMNIPLGDFNRGPLAAAVVRGAQGERLAPNICYEDLFGEELGARFTDAATAPTIFVEHQQHRLVRPHVAIDQHLQI